eukprot:GHVR01012130.1.p1 GENE.GHVR01012130.1~~GHVR01012130.1.p1  ORF type:complete len:257 (-),score=44.60 GHVR01012130.1:894-1664(-)
MKSIQKKYSLAYKVWDDIKDRETTHRLKPIYLKSEAGEYRFDTEYMENSRHTSMVKVEVDAKDVIWIVTRSLGKIIKAEMRKNDFQALTFRGTLDVEVENVGPDTATYYIRFGKICAVGEVREAQPETEDSDVVVGDMDMGGGSDIDSKPQSSFNPTAPCHRTRDIQSINEEKIILESKGKGSISVPVASKSEEGHEYNIEVNLADEDNLVMSTEIVVVKTKKIIKHASAQDGINFGQDRDGDGDGGGASSGGVRY